MRALIRKSAAIAAAALVLASAAACSPLRVINALTPGGSYTVASGLAYGPDARNRLDVYRPSDLAAGQLAPVVVFFFGGNWNSGSREDYAFVGEALASRGMVAVIADYRLYPQVVYPTFLQDAAQAVAWAARNAQNHGGDPQRLYVMGHSAGAYNAAMVALDPRWLGTQQLSPAALRGWIGLAGPYDFLPIQNRDTRPVFLHPDTPTASQPIRHVTSQAPRTLLLASRNDDLVDPTRNTAGLATRLRGAGVSVEEVYFDRTSHTTLIGAMSRPLRGLAPVLDAVDRFVMGPGSTAQ